MTTATLHMPTALPEARTEPKRGLLLRFLDAMIEARTRQAMREISMYRHLIPEHLVKGTGYQATVMNDGALPFTR